MENVKPIILDMDNKAEALANGICEIEILGCRRYFMKTADGRVNHYIFRNFTDLQFEEGMRIEGCKFENCGDITFDGCVIEGCSFQNITTIFSTGSDFTDTSFSELICDNDMIISLENTNMSRCRFDNIKLMKQAFLFDGDEDSWIEECEFSNISTTRFDKEIVRAEEVGRGFRKRKSFRILDEESCTGLEDIKSAICRDLIATTKALVY